MAEYGVTTPVLVGVGAVQQHIEDYECALEPVALMEQALRNAAVDAGSMQLLSLADEILVPKSLWSYTGSALCVQARPVLRLSKPHKTVLSRTSLCNPRMRCGHLWSQTAVWVCLSVTTLSSIARCATSKV